MNEEQIDLLADTHLYVGYDTRHSGAPTAVVEGYREFARALLSASIADTAAWMTEDGERVITDATKRTMPRAVQEPYTVALVKSLESIADTAGANCATCGAVGTVTSTKARCTLCGMFADTAGAKLTRWQKAQMAFGGGPAPSAADATVLRCGDCGSYHIERLEAYSSPVVAVEPSSVADAAGASETITLDMVRDAAFGAGLTLLQWDRLKFELKDAIAKESGND